MKNPLIINIRCSCIEEYINIQRLHKEYTRQLRTGEIMSVFVGAELAVPGEYEVVDKLMEKGGQCRKAPAVAFYPKVKEMTEEEKEALQKELSKGLVMVGPQPDEEIALPQAVDGGVDAMGNQPLPETHGQPVPQPDLQEVAKPAPDFVFEDEAAPKESFAQPEYNPSRDVRPEMVSGAFTNRFPEPAFKRVPETLIEEPSVAEEADDGCNGEDRNYTC